MNTEKEKSVSIGGETLGLPKDLELGVTTHDRGRLAVFFYADRAGVCAVVGGQTHPFQGILFPATLGQNIVFRERRGVLTSVTLAGLSPDKKSVLVH